MVEKKPRIVIIGAGMAGLTAANRLYKAASARARGGGGRNSEEPFELCIVEGGARIGGRINTSEFCGERIEMGATWIHGIGGSPIHKIAQEINSLESEQPWECMDGFMDDPVTVSEGGHELTPSIVDPISSLFKKLMDFAEGKRRSEEIEQSKLDNGGFEKQSLGYFLRQGLNSYWDSREYQEELKGCGNWTRKSVEEAIFAMFENTQRTYTSAGDLMNLDFNAESEYIMFPGEEITIAKGYLSIIESLASVLPPGLIQLGKKVTKIEWQPVENPQNLRPVTLKFSDGSIMAADHVIVTVSLGVLKQGIESTLFHPQLPCFKTRAISRLGYGVVNKLFLELSKTHDNLDKFPFLQLVFHNPESKFKHPEIPWWMRRTATLCPIHGKSTVLLAWFAGKEALELESLDDEEIIDGVSTTISDFLPDKSPWQKGPNLHEESSIFSRVLRSKWGNDPLFLGSYSYVAVGSSGDDLDAMAEPLPENVDGFDGANGCSSPPLQILFAGEATHRTHYSTTHGAYFSGLREANRLLQHYQCEKLHY